jgi:hypothetical protein
MYTIQSREQCVAALRTYNIQKEYSMKKLMLTLIALFSVATGLEARCNRGSCGRKIETITEGCAPKCYQWRKIAVCPEAHVVYSCPAGSNEGSPYCTPEEQVHGGAASTLD